MTPHYAPATSKRTVGVLAMGQAISMTGASMVMLVTALAGVYLASDDRLATLPLALQFVSTMLATYPASIWMRRVGRRVGFTTGQLIGLIGASVSALALIEGQFSLFLLGASALGIHNAFWAYYRFAAAESSAPEFRSRAISLVLAGGVLAAIVGPELAKLTQNLFAPIVFAGCYAAIAVLAAVNAALIQIAHLPPPRSFSETEGAEARPLLVIVRQPAFVVAALSAMVGYGVMILVMSETPLSMVECGFAFDDAAFVIQWHALAMFAPSFVTGSLIKRFGVFKILFAGIACNIVAMSSNLAGIELGNFWLGLVALGLGWNFLFIGGTTLLTECYRPEEQEKTQGVNDVLVFASISVATFSSGALQTAFGWTAVNAAVILPVMIAFAAVVWLARREAAAMPVQNRLGRVS